MPLRLEIKRKFTARSERVKSLDMHPTEPWVLCGLYSGQAFVWNYKTETLVKTFEVSELPVRSARFIARKQWIVTASDDMYIRVFNYNTMEKLKTFEGHQDFIRCLAVHPTQPFLLSASDDMTVKLWNWEKGWQCTQQYEGHTHYVMMVVFNPKDPNTFASASLDRTIKVWSIGSPVPNFKLEGHERGVNCVEYFTGGEKPYLVSGADDRTVKVWDYQNKTCVQTLEGHGHNVSSVCFHPTLPVIISGSEDSTVRIWNANTYRLEKTLNYSLERVWAIAYVKGSNKLAIGYDQGTVLVKLGSEEPAVSMDGNGKIVWAKHSEIQQINVKTASDEVADGERVTLPTKELGTCEVFPQSLQHNCNGRFVVVCGEGEYIIYTALAWRNKAFGSGLEFVWGNDTGEYAVRESTSKVKVYKNFEEHQTFRPSFSVEGISAGTLLGVRSSSFVIFYDWDEMRVIRKIDVTPKAIYWSPDGSTVVITCESSFYILRYNADLVAAAIEEQSGEPDPDGFPNAFEVIHEFGEKVRTGCWVGECFIYTNAANRLNYCVGKEIVTVSHLDRTMYLLGYMAKQNRLYLVDKSLNLVTYTLDQSILAYQTAILREDLDAAARIMPKIPSEHRNRIAQFLEAQGYKEQAMEVAEDLDLKFELAVQLNKVDYALSIARESDSDAKWRQLADLALQLSNLALAEESLTKASDLAGLLLLHSSTGDAEKIAELASLATERGQYNIAFVCLLLLKRVDECIEVLCKTNRVPEAAFLARTYKPSKVPEVVELWKESLRSVSEKAAESLADPLEYENLFPEYRLALKAEKMYYGAGLQSASGYSAGALNRDLLEEARTIHDDEAAPAEETVQENDEEEEEKEDACAPEPAIDASAIAIESREDQAIEEPQEETADVEDVASDSITEGGAVADVIDDDVDEILNKSIDDLLDE